MKKNVDSDGRISIYKEKLERRSPISRIISLFQSLMNPIIKKTKLIIQIFKIKKDKETLKTIYLNNSKKIKKSF